MHHLMQSQEVLALDFSSFSHSPCFQHRAKTKQQSVELLENQIFLPGVDGDQDRPLLELQRNVNVALQAAVGSLI